MTPEARPQLEVWLERWFPWLALAAVVANLSGAWLPLLDDDPALFASIARTMAESGDFVRLTYGELDWLDKPHFPFWMAALSFRAFGVSALAYRLPALAFWGLGAGYTFLLARRLGGGAAGRLAVLMLLAAQHLVMANADVRAEAYLVGLVTGAVYHFLRAQEPRSGVHLVLGAALSGCAVMTKGAVALVPVAGALLGHWASRREWRELLRPRWWIAAALVLVFILPEIVCLAVQFGSRPAAGGPAVGRKAIPFFLWESQLGRMLGTGTIRREHGSPLFFAHTLLWAFLPWSAWLLAAAADRIRRPPRLPPGLGFAWGAAVPALVLFSLSRFQLPHYLDFLFPFLAVITAVWVLVLGDEPPRWPVRLQTGVWIAVFALGPLLLLLARPKGAALAAALVGAGFGAALVLWRRPPLAAAVARSVAASVALNLVLNIVLSPELGRYQAASQAAAVLRRLPPRPTGVYATAPPALDFEAPGPVHRWSVAQVATAAAAAPAYVYLPQERQPDLEAAGLLVTALAVFQGYPVTKPTLAFLRAETRERVLKPMVLTEVRALRPPEPSAR
ncbi:MAG TPA: glycosyltransferase family 39 protein [Anaeromyxobacteraceae bacterium]|nr:glycosyltransferase family 39 protein [Anaeromyxobacteraceae bacterium]